MAIKFEPIGTIETPFKNRESVPHEPDEYGDVAGTVTLYPKFTEGLADLDGFSHIYLLFYFHKSEGYSLKVNPPRDNKSRGLFATRSPDRPCGIGLSVVRLIRIEENRLYVKDVDMLDGTPLLDIKPFITSSENRTDIRVGWLEGKHINK